VARLFGQGVLPPKLEEEVRQAGPHQEAQQALRFLHLPVQAAQPQVTLPIKKTLLNPRALTIRGDRLVAGKPGLGVDRHEQEPSVAKGFFSVDDDIDEFGL
jgi:hypothetical protein